jgi:hypothetical protein
VRLMRIAPCVFLLLSGPPAAAADGPLTLTALPVRASYSADDAVLVRLTLENSAFPDHWDAPFFVVIPRLTLGGGPAGWPYLVVRFQVTNPDGQMLVPKPIGLQGPKLLPPDTSWFAELHAGNFFGRVVDLRAPPYGFSFARRGTYVATASVASSAREWLDGWLKRHHRQAESLPFSYAHVFQGSVAAEPVRFTIGE